MIDTTSNHSKTKQSHTNIEKTGGDDEDSYLSGSEHEEYGGEGDDDNEDDQIVRDFDLTDQLSKTPEVPEYLHPLILTSE